MQVILIICCGTEIRKKLLLNLNNIPVKNKEKQQELINYLKKHIAEIIDYEKRQLAGRSIASGRCEKANDCLLYTSPSPRDFG